MATRVSDIFPPSGFTWRTLSTNANATNGIGYMVDTSGGAVTITLPSVPYEGYTIGILDASASFGTNSLTIERNGQPIMGIAQNMVLSSNYKAVTLTYSDSTNGWRISNTTPCQVGDLLSPRAAQKNLLINGNGIVNQRAVTIGSAVANTDFYCDRIFTNYNVGTIVKAGEAVGSLNVRGLETTTAVASLGATDYISPWKQRLEGFDAAVLTDGATITVSFYARSSVAGTHCVRLQVYSDTTEVRRYITEFTIAQADTDEYQTVTIDIPAGYVGASLNTALAFQLSIGDISGTTYHALPDTWILTTNVIATAACVNWAVSAGNSFQVSKVQLEVGSTATDFEYRSYGEELALCQRYYISDTSIRAWQWGAAVTNGDICGLTVNYPTTMRTTPTVVATVEAATALTLTSTLSGDGSFVLAFGATATATNAFIRGSYTADAEL